MGGVSQGCSEVEIVINRRKKGAGVEDADHRQITGFDDAGAWICKPEGGRLPTD